MSDQELLDFIQTQIAQSSNRLSGYLKDIQGQTLHKRNVYLVLEEYLKGFIQRTAADPRMIIMPGLRGAGKTTLLAQLFLSPASLDADKLYISADEVTKRFDTSLWKILDHYENLTGLRLEERTQPLIFFFDEIHYDLQWDAFLKSIYDRSKQVMVICTGSSALLLRDQMNADLSRRAVFVDIHPVSFSEYMLLVGVFANYQGHLLEDIAGMYFNRILERFGERSLTCDPTDGGADFIVTRAEQKIVVEAGIGEKDNRQVMQTMRKIGGQTGMVLHSGPLELDRKNNIVSVPWKWFLLI